MKYSIIVPIYNAEKYIAQCIESVLTQAFKDYELILVDDGSTDSSSEICKGFAKGNSKIKFFSKNNSGPVETRLFGIKESSGEYIISLDADDLLKKNALSIIENKLNEYDVDMLIFSYQRFKNYREIIDESASVTDEEQADIYITDKRELYIKILFDERYNSLCTKVVRRKFLLDRAISSSASFWHGEDLVQTLDIIKQNPKTLLIQDSLYYYRMNPASMTMSIDIYKYTEDIIKVRETVLNFLLSEEVFTEVDFYEYRGVAIALLTNGIATVARQDVKLKEKIKCLKKIMKTNYYLSFINKGKYNKDYLGNKHIVWWLYQHGLYQAINILFWLKTKVSVFGRK